MTLAEIIAWDPAVAALAETRPVWEPGTAHGYHAITYGWLVGEVIARVTGQSPGAYFAAEIAEPLGLDFHIGLPEAEFARVSPVRPASAMPGYQPDALARRVADPSTLAHRANFLSSGLLGALNDQAVWRAEIPGLNGIATAHAVARVYAACLGEIDGVGLLDPDTVSSATVLQAAGLDAVMGYETRYALGFQLPFPYRTMAGPGSFGHYGVGGSVGFAHPELGLSFGYTVNQMGPGTPADPRSAALIDAVVGCLNRGA